MVTVKKAVLWNITPCSSERAQCFPLPKNKQSRRAKEVYFKLVKVIAINLSFNRTARHLEENIWKNASVGRENRSFSVMLQAGGWELCMGHISVALVCT
jgi:hypothetical protein